jgi:hypothetical protein
MKFDPVLLAYILTQALLSVQRAIEAFQAVHGRAPTLEEWKTLEGAWKSPDEIEAGVKALLAGGFVTGPKPG